MNLTIKQAVWLDTRGGRDESDVKKDKDGMYIEMGRKIYIPEDSKLIIKYSGRYRVADIIN